MKNKKRILITASTFPRYAGDSEPRFILDLAKALLPYYDVTVLVPSAPEAKDSEVLEGVKVIRYHYFPIHKWESLCYPGAIVPRIKEKKIRILLVPCLFIGLYLAIRKRIKEYDIVHANWLIPQGIVQSFFDKPYLVTGHGGDVTSLNTGIMKSLKRRALERASAVTMVSENLAAEAMQIVDKEVRMSILSMGVCLDFYNQKYRVEDRWKQKDKKVLLFVGRLAEKKGVTYLLRAMKYILEQGEEAVLVIVGDGPLKNVLQEQSHAEGIEDCVIFEGAKSRQELQQIYASADIFIMPSITAKDGDKEGFGLVMLEAMASGLPVIASNSGGICNVIHDWENGILCEAKNPASIAKQVLQVIQDRELYVKLQENGLKFAEAFDYKVIGKRYAELCDEILGG